MELEKLDTELEKYKSLKGFDVTRNRIYKTYDISIPDFYMYVVVYGNLPLYIINDIDYANKSLYDKIADLETALENIGLHSPNDYFKELIGGDMLDFNPLEIEFVDFYETAFYEISFDRGDIIVNIDIEDKKVNIISLDVDTNTDALFELSQILKELENLGYLDHEDTYAPLYIWEALEEL